MPVETGTTTGTSASSGGGSSGGQGGQNNGLTKGYVGAPGTNNGAWSGDGVNLGLTTGTTWYGNTAFGPAGGMATGYATRDGQSLAGAGMAPTMGTYSNFNTMNGQPMFGGALGGQGFNGMNANQAYGAAQNWYQALQAYAQAKKAGNTGTAPLPPLGARLATSPPPAVPLDKSMMPAFFRQPQTTAPAVNNFGPRTYDGGYTYSTTKNNSMLNNPQFGYTGGSLANYGGGVAGNKTSLR